MRCCSNPCCFASALFFTLLLNLLSAGLPAIRIAREFGVKLTLEHCTEGHLIVEELKRAGCPVAVGPTLTHASKYELVNKTFATPGILARAGIQVSIITDSPVIPSSTCPCARAWRVKAGDGPL